VDAAAEPVTVTVARRVAPGREADFASWCDAVTAAAATYPGHLGAGVLRPSRLGEPWHLVFRFASAQALRTWEDSAQRRRLLEAGEHLVHSTDVQRVTGLETWFALPGRTSPAPPKWKMFAVSVCGIYALQLLLNVVIDPLGLPVALRVLAVSVAVTALMTWLVMPRAARLLQDWLYAPPPR
jgi:antibiotic biosynthesis monooxygenase (ABM) superfamily enzyme